LASSGAWIDELRRALEHVRASDATEVELAEGGFRLRLKRRPGARPAPSEPAPAAPAPAAAGAAVVAPLTGVFYRAPSPADPPYVDVGDAVEPRTVVGLIETMKIFNEVLAERTGRIAEILVESGDLVHAGDALMTVADDAAGAGEQP
jgi:acetyl-CoA carboxylase biotin carboxyl carrier protein